MLTVGWVGLGKLGLACALALEHYGHQNIVGYDRSPAPARILDGSDPLPREHGIDALIGDTQLKMLGTIEAVVAATDNMIMVSVQTPHDPDYGGEQPMPAQPQDFEYGYLVQAVRDVDLAARRQHKRITIVVISTVLPGTTRALLMPMLSDHTDLVYGPYFIAMGTTIADFIDPEFVLLGSDQPGAIQRVVGLYHTMHSAPIHAVSIESAELLKVAYNCFISTKIVFANMLMEICHKTGADVDEISDGLRLATRRVASGAYLRGGVGDGGACHPRDNMAMSWLAQRLDLSVDLMGFVSHAREQQSQWLADLVAHWVKLTGMPVMVLGKSYKPESGLTYGSAALLLHAQLEAGGLTVEQYDSHTDARVGDEAERASVPRVYVIGTKHEIWRRTTLAQGSVIIDPFGYIPDQAGVTVVRVGRKL